MTKHKTTPPPAAKPRELSADEQAIRELAAKLGITRAAAAAQLATAKHNAAAKSEPPPQEQKP